MTDTKPTIDEQIAFEKNILPIAAGGMHEAILASLEELKRIHDAKMPVEPMQFVWRSHGMIRINSGFFVAIQSYEELLAYAQRKQDENEGLRKLLVEAAEDIESWGAHVSEYFQKKFDLAGNAKQYRDAAIDAAIKEQSHD